MGEKAVRRAKEGGKEASQKREQYQISQGNLPNLELYLFLKKCKQYSLFDLVRLQNGWQWFRGPREFDGKLLTLTNGSLQTNAEVASPREEQGTLPDGKETQMGRRSCFKISHLLC